MSKRPLPITKNIELVLLKHSTKKLPSPESFTDIFCQTLKDLAPVLCKLSSKMGGERTLPNSFYEASITLIQNQVKTFQKNKNSTPVMNGESKVINKILAN